MATATHALVDALTKTAARIADGGHYRWTHMGACTCGHLAQTVTQRDRAEIHRLALQRAGDWGAQGVEYCASSGLPIDHIITELLAIGLTTDDLGHLEKLSDRAVLRRLPEAVRRGIDYRNPGHVVMYLRTFAQLLAETLPERHATVAA